MLTRFRPLSALAIFPATLTASFAARFTGIPVSVLITSPETRATVLGHIQRGGAPSAFDRVLATRLGLHAADAVVDGAWGQMVALRGTDIVRVPFADALGELNTVPLYRYEEAAALFG